MKLLAITSVLLMTVPGAWAAAQTSQPSDRDTGRDQPAAKDTGTSEDPGRAAQPKKKMRETPFGPVPVDPNWKPAPQRTTFGPFVRFERKGDLYIFRRETPFGDQVWKRKKGELNELERELVNREKSGEKPSPASTSAVGKERGRGAKQSTGQE